MSPLLLKITVAPALVGGASLVGRRFGAGVSGWLIGFPIVAAPVLWFYAAEQGAVFASRAAAGTLWGLLSLCVFLLIYVWSCQRLSWFPSVLLGWLGFATATGALAHFPRLSESSWQTGLLVVFVALTLTRRALPRPPSGPWHQSAHRDLGWRMVATALLVAGLTGVAHLLGPTLSGLLTPFPVATTVLVVFAHREAGAGGVLAVCAGFVPSLHSFACFCAALAFALQRWQTQPAFLFALLVTSVAQLIVLRAIATPAVPSAVGR